MYKKVILSIVFSLFFNLGLSNELEKKEIRLSVYDKPYSFLKNDIDYKLVKTQLTTIGVASVASLAILYTLPSSVTNWDEGFDINEIFSKWWRNVKEGPVVDEDDWFLNYITHPYFGAVYYMAARSAGYNAPYSFLASFIMSTFFWEYGVEAFAEVPSTQDLIITPVIGSLLGELFYLGKRNILNNNRELLNSRVLGNVSIFLMDPVTEIANLFIKDKRKMQSNEISIYSTPSLNRNGNLTYNVYYSMKF